MPFSSIGIEEQGSYLAQVQTAYRELAFKHHPDTSSGGKSSDTFVRIKDAFQSIMEGPSGIAVLRNHHFNKDQQSSDENELDVKWKHSEGELNNYQDEHNGLLHPSVNPQVLHEIADIAENMNPGGLDRGGMWQYANMISNLREKSGSAGLPPLRVEGGVDANQQDGDTRKRMRRRRK